MTNILIAAGVMGLMGLVFGAVLSIVGQKFSVPENPLKASVRELLPGANCGGCGYPGCDGYADAVANGTAAVNQCPVGGDSVAAQIGEVMGVVANAMDKQVATVMCRGGMDKCGTRFEYAGPKDCKSASVAGQGDKSCSYACLGLGDCEKGCPFGAISINEQRLAVVDEEKCNGCGACAASCPKGILVIMPQKHSVHRQCSAMEKGKIVKDNCSAGCVGCGKCARVCQFGALTMKDDLPQIDLEKCTGCMLCADSCPTAVLQAREAMRRHAVIDFDRCDGCGDCEKVCKFEAIVKNTDGKHAVIDWNCTGCGQCVKACEKGCARLVKGGKYRGDARR